MDEIRLNKYISDAGVCSRREADRLITQGRVRIDGRIAGMGEKVLPGMRVEVDGQPIHKEAERIFLAFYKPKGIVCTADRREKDNVIDYIGFPKRITYLGRLDKDSSGLLLLTNDGDINNRMMRSRNEHEKEYLVEVDHDIDEEFLTHMSEGVAILDTITKKCKVTQTGPRRFRIILTQGLNRQIRRMCEALGYQVKKLKRIRVMNITLGDLKPGEYRYLTVSEVQELDRLTQGQDD